MNSGEEQLVCVCLADVPEYLRDSELYRTFLQNDDGQQQDNIMIPTSCFKNSLNINNREDLRRLLNTLRYWLVAILPDVAHNFIIDTLRRNEDVSDQIDDYKEAFPSLGVFTTTRDQWPAEAARCGLLTVMKCLRKRGFKWTGSECCVAASAGHLDCLKYAHLNGCAWSQVALPSKGKKRCDRE